jgi:hypothetical protein
MRKKNPRKLKTNVNNIGDKPIDHSIILDVICGDKMMKLQNNFMHACDVFEKGKHLGQHLQLEATGNPNMEKLCENVKNAYEQASEGYVLFIAIRTIDGERCKEPQAIFNKGIQTISDGSNFGLFKNILKQLGYEAETNEYMMVESIAIS